MIAQDLWHAHYKIFLIILLKEFIKWDVNIEMILKMWNMELNIKIVNAALNMQMLKII